MTPPRTVLESWRALTTAQLVGGEFGRHAADLDRIGTDIRAACHELNGPDWRGAAYDRLLAYVEAAHRGTRLLSDRVEALCDAGTRSLSALYYTAQALLDYVADAEDAGCLVADDWSVLPAAITPDAAQAAVADEWAEVIAEGVRAVDRADERGRAAVRAAGVAIAALSAEFDRLGLLPVDPPAATGAVVAGVSTPASCDPERDAGQRITSGGVGNSCAGTNPPGPTEVSPPTGMDRRC